MIKANYKDKYLVINILHDSFYNILIPNSINFIIKKDNNRSKKLMALMKFQFKMSLKYGEVFLSDDKNGCILYLDKVHFSFSKLIWELELLIKCIGIENIFKILKREKLLKSFHTKEKFKHLWLMGVKSDFQGKGIGSNLIKESLEKYKGESIYVETTTNENLKFYKKQGFKIFHETYELEYPLFFLKYV